MLIAVSMVDELDGWMAPDRLSHEYTPMLIAYRVASASTFSVLLIQFITIITKATATMHYTFTMAELGLIIRGKE